MVLTRRAALKGAFATAIGAAAGVGVYGMAYERHHLEIASADLPVSGLAPELDGFRIGLITDVHHSATVPAADVSYAVQRLLSTTPDLIVLGGDYVTWSDRDYLEPVADLLAPLAAPHGVFAILGNHDDDRDTAAALARRRMAVLRDQRTRVTVNGAGLELAGLRFWTRKPAEIARVLRNARDPVVMLAHDPRRLTEAAALNVQVVLSGHTHGGQVVVPGVGAIARRRFPVVAGQGTRGNTSIFVSKGIGTVYVPVRFNCPPDVAVVTLRRQSAI
jgi:predicted MPP superfamily phosphohydrolase